MKLRTLLSALWALSLSLTASAALDQPGSLLSSQTVQCIQQAKAESVFDEVHVPEGFQADQITLARQQLGPAKFAVDLVQITYLTQGVDGKPARASGLLMEPRTGRGISRPPCWEAPLICWRRRKASLA